MANVSRKSDGIIVPKKQPNKEGAAAASAEVVEERVSAKGKPKKGRKYWTQSQGSLKQDLARLREAAKRRKGEQLTSLWHHVYRIDALWKAFFELKADAAPGVDGETWHGYKENLLENLKSLSERLGRESYRALPVKRVYIPKSDDKLRPIGITALEDKIVQRATVDMLQQIYEVDFKGFSYGFRPGRNQHMALDAVMIALEYKKVNWVLDADIRGFFDTINHDCLIRFMEHRIGDPRVIRQIKKWLKAGVMEDGVVKETTTGTPQGGSISPLLANIYLHYGFDLWVDKWRRKKKASGEVYVIRFADDIVLGFQVRSDAMGFHEEMTARLKKFDLELHPEKTRLIKFGRYASVKGGKERKKPETFKFLGFVHACGRKRTGGFEVVRSTDPKKRQAKTREIKDELRKRMHDKVHDVGTWLGAVLTGHYNYYGVPGNSSALWQFRRDIGARWFRTLRRRSQKHTLTWEKMDLRIERFLPPARITHPYPRMRFRVTT
jgi:group II intron reverse transcriptase/maturase